MTIVTWEGVCLKSIEVLLFIDPANIQLSHADFIVYYALIPHTTVTTSTSGSTTANSETFTDNSETTTTSNSRSVADLRTDTTTASSSLITTKCINVLPQNSANQTLKVSLSLVAFILSLSMALYLL